VSVERKAGTKNKDASRGAGLVVNVDDKPRVHRPMKTVTITGDDAKHTKEIVEEHFPGTAEKTQANIQHQHEEQRQGELIAYPNGMKLQLAGDHAENALRFMRQHAPKGPPATKTTVMIPGYFKGGRLVREGDPDY
jgi:hypothetical protein